MKNILIPTDLSVKSLQVVHEVVQRHNRESLQIHVIHMLHIPTDIMELMFFRKSSMYERVPAEFNEALQLLSNKYATTLSSIHLEFYYGNYAGALNTVIENCKIDEVCLLNGYKYALPFSNSVNIIPFLKRSKVPVYRMQLQGNVTMNNAHLFSSLFVDKYNNIVAQKNTPSAY